MCPIFHCISRFSFSQLISTYANTILFISVKLEQFLFLKLDAPIFSVPLFISARYIIIMWDRAKFYVGLPLSEINILRQTNKNVTGVFTLFT